MLDEIEKSVLEKLTFEEHFHHILEEMDFPRPVVADVLKTLLVKEMVHAFTFNEKTNSALPTAFCDTDNLQDYLFRATKKGMDALYKG